jgi:ATP-binding cassette subfamily B protein
MPMADTTTTAAVRDWRFVRRLLAYWRPHVTIVYAAIATLVVGTIVELVQPWLTQRAIDEHIATGDTVGLTRVAVLLVGTLVVGFGCDYGRTRLLQLLGQRVVQRLRADVYRHLQTLDLRFYDVHPVGQVMTSLTSDIDALNEAFSSGAVLILGNILTLVGIVIAMLGMNWRLAGVTFAVLPLAAWVTHAIEVRIRESFRRIRAASAQLSGFLQEHLAGMPTVQLFMQEERVRARFDAMNALNRDAGLASQFHLSLLNPTVEIIAACSAALVVWVGGLWTLQGSVSVGVLVAFVLYLRRFFQPFLDLAEKASVLQGALASAERVFRRLDTPPAIASPAVPVRASSPPAGRIELDGVWFAYRDQFVLKDVSFTIEPGERVGIAGPTGSGKTTLLNLLLRFYDVSRGRVLVDGVDVRDWDEHELRRMFNVVLQDSYLFPGTVADNMRGATDGISPADLVRTARALRIDDLIGTRLGGYQAAISERSPLSVGEKQLLAFARTTLSPSPIVLLDEATSGLDDGMEARVDAALRRALGGRTLIAVAHRLSTIRRMDRILTFHKGELREAGSHDDLLRREGIYYRMYQLQESAG